MKFTIWNLLFVVLFVESLGANGVIVWEKSSALDPYTYPVKNFDNTIWLDKKNKEYSSKSWAEADKYCKNLSITMQDTDLNRFHLAGKEELEILFEYRDYSGFYDKEDSVSGVWSNIEEKNSDYKRRVAQAFYLGLGEYSNWYYSCKENYCSHPTKYEAVCVYEEPLDLAYLGVVDLKKSETRSVNDIASQMYDSKLRYLAKPPRGSKPQKIEYEVMQKDEFETTKQFTQRVQKHKQEVDARNREAMQRYKDETQRVEKLSAQKLKSFKQNREEEYNKFLKQAQIIKYGAPKVKDVKYDADREVMSLLLVSTRGNYSNHVEVPVKLKYAREFKNILINPNFEPKVELSVNYGELVFKNIEQIKDPELLVVEKELKDASDSIAKLEKFLLKYQSSSFSQEAKDRIDTLQKREFDNSYNSRVRLEDLIEKYPNSPYSQDATARVKVLKAEEKIREAQRAKEAKERAARVAAAKKRKSDSYYKHKSVGEKVCKDGVTALILSITITAYVENVNGSKIQLRIADTEGTSPHMNGVTLYPDTVIWDDYRDWYICNY